MKHLVAALLCLWLGSAQAKDHVLILTISNYVDRPLRGVHLDAQNALAMAGSLGYDVSQAVVVKDSALDSRGLRQALAALVARVQDKDRVFLYYSGHGASLRVGAMCQQALVAQDGGLLAVGELYERLDAIKQRTHEVLVVMDACHAGGMQDLSVTRSSVPATSVDAFSAGLRPKTFQPREGEACHSPSNLAQRWTPASQPTRARFPENNFTFIAAANAREVALDDDELGGLASYGLRSCASEGVPDQDGSGQISPQEWLACAQAKVAARVPAINAKLGTRWVAHQLEAYGNTQRALPMAVHPTTLPAPSTPDQRSGAALEQLVATADGNWDVHFEMPTQVKMGTTAAVHYRSSQPGFLTILYFGSDGKDIDILSYNTPLQATPRRLLGNIPITDCPGGCPGANSLLFLVTAQKLDATALLESAKAGRLPNTSEGLLALRCGLSAGPRCGTQRNAGALVIAEAPQGYAAQLLQVTGY